VVTIVVSQEGDLKTALATTVSWVLYPKYSHFVPWVLYPKYSRTVPWVSYTKYSHTIPWVIVP
jgi:hypothetical protein